MTVDQELQTLRDAEQQLQEAMGWPLALREVEAQTTLATLRALPRAVWWVAGPRQRAAAALRGVRVAHLASSPMSGHAAYKLAPCAPTAGMRALHAVGLCMSGARALLSTGPALLAQSGGFQAMNIAALRGLPLTVVMHEPLFDGAPVPAQTSRPPEKVCRALGWKVHLCEAADTDTLEKAVARAVNAKGPQLIVVREAPAA
ncbi:MAG: hypothetical protein ACON5B_13130 [Myxococcota bacterium]